MIFSVMLFKKKIKFDTINGTFLFLNSNNLSISIYCSIVIQFYASENRSMWQKQYSKWIDILFENTIFFN